MLTQVQRPTGVRDYTYQDGLVTKVSQDGQTVHRFAYNDRGLAPCAPVLGGWHTFALAV